MSDPVAQHEPDSTSSRGSDNLTLEFELTYPNAVDSDTLGSAANFHNSYSGDVGLLPKQWAAKYKPEVANWTDWALVRAVREDTREVRGQCVVVRWDVGRERSGEKGKVLFVLELIGDEGVGKNGGEDGKDMRRELLRQVREERMLMMDVGVIGCLRGEEGVVKEAFGLDEAGKAEQDLAKALEGRPVEWLKERAGDVVSWEV